MNTKTAENVDYKNIFNLKFPVFHLIYKNFISKHKNDKWKKDFENYKKAEGQELLNLCKLESLLDAKNETLIDFYAYLHFITHTQLYTLKKQAEKLGIGLYLDIPVGAYTKSSEVKFNKNLFMKNVLIGSPPEKSRPFGQDWGVVPTNSMELLKTGYKSYRKLLSSVMKYAGAVRIDHAFSLVRLFCITKNLKDKNNGAYINYNFNHLISVLLIEAHKNKCLVVGEDLGVAPTGFNTLLKKYKIFSNKVVYYNKDKSKKFTTSGFPYHSLCQISTHDAPTSKGFWSFEDLKINNKCGLYKSQKIFESEIQKRRQDKKLFYEIFKNNDCFCDNKDEIKQSFNSEIIPKNIEYSFNKYGCKTGSAIFMMRLEDLIGDTRMQNVPGVDYKKYPVWNIKLNKNLNEIEKTIKNFTTKNKR